jgi:NAD(P)-dependent dehydrogenase (short-subunit alcohol dehydrogenase family)
MDGEVLIVGGRSGIGAATAELLAKRHAYEGMHIAIPDHHQLDISSVISTESYVSKYGPFTHIIYSAGINRLRWAGTRKISLMMEDHFSINCAGFVELIGAHTRIHPTAYLSAVAVSSDAGSRPMRGSVAYCASKAALNMAVKVMARELAPLHRINAVAPGMVEGTPMTAYIDDTIPEFRGWTEEEARAYELQNTPTKRRATLGEVADTIEWVLFGPDQMTGAIIDINGGK